MKAKRYLASVFLGIFLVAFGGPLAADWPTDQQNHMLPLFYALWSKYVEDLQGGNSEKLGGWFTEEAVLMEAGKPDVIGREAIRKHLEGIFATSKVTDADIKPGQTDVCGDRVYQFGTYSRTLESNGKPTNFSTGRFFSIWDRQADGSWKLSRLMFSTTQ